MCNFKNSSVDRKENQWSVCVHTVLAG